MVSKQRARTGADKLARRIQILEAALALWEEKGYDAVTMSQVAERLQLAKGTLYLYFPSKEELFLAIYLQLVDEWFGKAEHAVESLNPATPLGVSKALVSNLIGQPNLMRLIPLVAPVIERNIGPEVGLQYRRWLLGRITSLGELIEDKMNGLSPGTGNDALVYFFSLVSGLGPMGDPSDQMKPVVDDPSMLALKVDFGPALQHGFATLLTGFQRLVK